ncbi:hypothetical protein U1Q18_032204, partial [Sarracenia purpurea var. burkii]
YPPAPSRYSPPAISLEILILPRHPIQLPLHPLLPSSSPLLPSSSPMLSTPSSLLPNSSSLLPRFSAPVPASNPVTNTHPMVTRSKKSHLDSLHNCFVTESSSPSSPTEPSSVTELFNPQNG